MSSEQPNLWPVAERLSEKGHQVSIISHKNASGQAELEKNNTTIYFLSTKKKFQSIQEFSKTSVDKIIEIHKDQNIDHIHSMDTPIKDLKKKWPGKKLPTLSYGVQASSMEEMFSMYSSTSNTLKALLLSTFFYPLLFIRKYFIKDYLTLRRSQGVFVSSPKQAMALERYYLYPRDHIYQVPLDSLMSSLILKKKSSKLMESLKINEGDQVVATASDMKRPNEIYFILDVFESVALMYPKAKLLIIGNGPFFKDIEKRVLLKALDSRVIFTKKVTSIALPDYISLSDIFINFNFKTSGLGRTLVEAMAQKKVIIGSELSPISSIIDNGKNGFLLRPGENLKCVQLIDSIFSGSVKKEALGNQAREDVLNIFDQDLLAEKALKAFDDIRNRKSLFRQAFFN